MPFHNALKQPIGKSMESTFQRLAREMEVTDGCACHAVVLPVAFVSALSSPGREVWKPAFQLTVAVGVL